MPRRRKVKHTLADMVLSNDEMHELGLEPGEPIDWDEETEEARLDEIEIIAQIRRQPHIGEFSDD